MTLPDTSAEMAQIGEPALLLRAVPEGGAAAAVALAALDRPWDDGTLWALFDPAAEPDDPPAAVALVGTVGGWTVELRAVAAPTEGLTARLLTALGDALRRQGIRRVIAAASDADLGQLRTLLRAGFRPTHVERDGCTPQRGWPEHAGRDLFWLDLAL
jgi:hypothetical protein